MRFIDTHMHLSDEAYRGEEEAVLERALSSNVYKMMMADIDSSERGPMLALCDAHPGVLYPMLGFYPGYVRENWQEEVDEVIRECHSGRKFVAIGSKTGQAGEHSPQGRHGRFLRRHGCL